MNKKTSPKLYASSEDVFCIMRFLANVGKLRERIEDSQKYAKAARNYLRNSCLRSSRLRSIGITNPKPNKTKTVMILSSS